jgi:hypothetical protein
LGIALATKKPPAEKRRLQLFYLVEKSRAIPRHVRDCPNIGAWITPTNAFGSGTPTACGNIIVFLEVN